MDGLASSGSPPLLRGLFEVVAVEMGMGQGQWRLELRFRDGRLQDVWRHDERIPPGALQRFEASLLQRVRELVGP